MERARIIIDPQHRIDQSWCWRDDWNTGFDSVFGLLAKFARLNSMGARELASVFIKRDCVRRDAVLRAPKVDLRSCELLDRSAFAKHCRLDAKAIERAFITEKFSKASHKTSNSLRWCPQCARNGFHSALFQLDLVSACPIHDLMLRNKCPRCQREIAYILASETFERPFCCPWCENDLAPSLRHIRPLDLTFEAMESSRLENLTQLLIFERDMVPLRLALNRERKQLGLGEFAIAHPDWRRIESEYIGFVAQVIESLQIIEGVQQQRLPLVSIVVTVKQPIREKDPKGVVKSQRRRASKVSVDEINSMYVKRNWDEKLKKSYDVYNSVRRHIWRHMVGKHQACIAKCARHLWWNMEGERTCPICPIAEAFIRWRAHWEGCGTPRYLFSPMRKDPMGLVAWLASGAPVCPQGWSIRAEQWVNDHLLGTQCIGSFWEFFETALENEKNGHILWERRVNAGRYSAYWAIVGADTVKSPVCIYHQGYKPNSLAAALRSIDLDRNHTSMLLSQLSKIVR